jgi:hypothetical protein
LYNFLRFHAFDNISDTEKKELFLSAQNVELRKPHIFKKIVIAVNNNNFEALQRIMDDEKINITAIVRDVGKDAVTMVTEQRWQIIMDAYFQESEEYLALQLLETLIYYLDLDAMKGFINDYLSATPEIRSHMTSGQIPYAVMI